jgi:hypothetical protein
MADRETFIILPAAAETLGFERHGFSFRVELDRVPA